MSRILYRLPVVNGRPEGIPLGASWRRIIKHNDGSVTVEVSGPTTEPGLDGKLALLEIVKEPRQRRALQNEVEREIESLPAAEKAARIAQYRGLGNG